MKVIPIQNPIDYFEITTPNGNDIWTFIFTWSEKYSMFHVDALLNGSIYTYSVAVLGGVFVFKDFSLGYNFYFLGETRTYTDLGNSMIMYLLTTEDATELGILV
jgi:hypothetical protein